jgi:branched-chain amino acid transport system substrate-binding protein
MGMLAQSRTEAGVNADLLGPWTLALRSAEDRGGKALEGAAMAQTIVPDTTLERRTSFIARLHRLRGKEPLGSLMAAAQSYDAVYLMLGALFQTQGRTDGDALKTALEHLNRPYSGVVTTYDQPFSPSDHDAISANMLWLATWRRGNCTSTTPRTPARRRSSSASRAPRTERGQVRVAPGPLSLLPGGPPSPAGPGPVPPAGPPARPAGLRSR